MQTDFHENYSVSNDQSDDKMSESYFFLEQHNNPNISALFENAFNKEELT